MAYECEPRPSGHLMSHRSSPRSGLTQPPSRDADPLPDLHVVVALNCAVGLGVGAARGRVGTLRLAQPRSSTANGAPGPAPVPRPPSATRCQRPRSGVPPSDDQTLVLELGDGR